MDHHMITQILQNLERGRNSVHLIRDLMNQRRGSTSNDHDHQDYVNKGLDDHSMVALTALDSALSILHNSENHFSLEDTNSVENSLSIKKDKRGCYKRRRSVESVVKDTTNLTDDGFAWRKYGQKEILNTTHPRNYYRCTHKIEQGCQATKQVQQISENPTMYRIIYHGNHSCKSSIKNPLPILVDSNPDSSIYLSFESNQTPAKHTLNSDFVFPSSTMVKQEHGPVTVETPSEPSDVGFQYNNSSSSPSPSPSSPDLRSEISSAEEQSYYSYFMADSLDLDQVLMSIFPS